MCGLPSERHLMQDALYYHWTTTMMLAVSLMAILMVRLSLDVEIKKPIRWGAYMGSSYDGILK